MNRHAPEQDTIADVSRLEELLSDPSERAVDAMRRLEGDVIVLGVGGKMGPTLARMAKRASDLAGVRRRVIGVARFATDGQARALEAHGVEALRCDLFDAAAVARLPEVENVVFMAGRKFGSTGQEWLTWAINCHVPAVACQRFPRSRMVAFSTGNVYGLTPVGSGGSVESDPLRPVGEYAMSCVGRERIFEHFSREHGLRLALLRLNYASEMRYGVLVDLARQVLAGAPVSLAMGYFNVIWQADANAMALAAFDHAASPPVVVNVAGPEELPVRATCETLADLMACRASFAGEEAADALLSNGTRGWSLLGHPRVDAARLVAWTADWVRRGGETLGKPTHFESRAGTY